MNLRRVIIHVSMAACFSALALVFIRQEQIAELRRQHQNSVSQSPATSDTESEATPSDTDNRAAESRPSYTPSVELLRFRNQVTQLGNRKRELAGVRSENGRLRGQLAASKTNSTAATGMPPDYVPRSKTRLVGFATPEDTVQSFLWALDKRDWTNLLQALTPECAQRIRAQDQPDSNPLEGLFQVAKEIPGMRICDRRQLPDNSVELKVEFVPGMPAIPRFRLRQIAGQWKMENLPQ